MRISNLFQYTPFTNRALNAARGCKSKIKSSSELLRLKNYVNAKGCDIKNFHFLDFKSKLVRFLIGHRHAEFKYKFYYSKASTLPSLYASVYALMTFNMLGELDEMSSAEKHDWINYFNSFQTDQGLFDDASVSNDIYQDSDWWGARHLALHMISGYTGLCTKPKKPFRFLSQYRSEELSDWLDRVNWSSSEIGYTDIDNKIMNIGCLLQFQRDQWGDKNAFSAISHLKKVLKERINSQTGMWGIFNVNDPFERSRMVQFAYHLYPLFFYDEDYSFDWQKIVQTTLQTQNRLGGFGVKLNSSACEDIDSIDLLIRAFPFVNENQQQMINKALKKAFKWVTSNQVDDGGFVFRLNEEFLYGSIQTSSCANQGAMMPTWFRTLSILYMTKHFSINTGFKLTKCPGYEQ